MKKHNLFLILFLVAFCYSSNAQKYPKVKKPKNIILLIGDGMGLTQAYTAITAKCDNTYIAKMPVTGFSKTFSLDHFITDSAAGGTALATGQKTKNGYIAVDSLGNKIETILEKAEKKGLATGLVATSTITHATPASFIGHDKDRGNEENIARCFLDTDIDVFFGGGWNHFGARKDRLNLIDSLNARHYLVTRSIDDPAIASAKKVAGFLADDALPKKIDGRGDMLPKATEKTIDILKNNKKGFFLMVEGSQIDWACHNNELDYLIGEVTDFDDAVGKALEFARKDQNTLVIVTADHETGGFAITGGDLKTGKVEGQFTSKNHTAVMVPVYAFGPGAVLFTGVQDNTDIAKKMLYLLNLPE